jgi:hypothetical protein
MLHKSETEIYKPQTQLLKNQLRKEKKNQPGVEIFQKRKDCQQKMRCGSEYDPFPVLNYNQEK